jgi:hypothetical protein
MMNNYNEQMKLRIAEYAAEYAGVAAWHAGFTSGLEAGFVPTVNAHREIREFNLALERCQGPRLPRAPHKPVSLAYLLTGIAD